MEDRLKEVADGDGLRLAQMRARHFNMASTAHYIAQGGEIGKLISTMAHLIVLTREEWNKMNLGGQMSFTRTETTQPAPSSTGTQRWSRQRKRRWKGC